MCCCIGGFCIGICIFIPFCCLLFPVYYPVHKHILWQTLLCFLSSTHCRSNRFTLSWEMQYFCWSSFQDGGYINVVIFAVFLCRKMDGTDNWILSYLVPYSPLPHSQTANQCDCHLSVLWLCRLLWELACLDYVSVCKNKTAIIIILKKSGH